MGISHTTRQRPQGPPGPGPDERRQRGAVLVEAAFVMPILMLLTFGIIEFGMAYGNAATVGNSSRSGARLAATGYASAADKSAYIETIGDAVKKDLSALSNGGPVEMWVYKANSGVPTSCTAGNNCWAMTWNTTTKDWGTPTGGWASPDACGDTVDTLGVYVKATHKFVSGYFGSTKTIIYRTTARIEPLPSDQCVAGS